MFNAFRLVFGLMCLIALTPFTSLANTPIESFVGKCSWYGPGFHTRTTANGEKYDMYGISAAHKKLPFNTLVRLTHLKKQRSIVVRVNDRGPVAPSLTLDLSYGAAMGLTSVQEGKAEVLFEIVGTTKKLLTEGERFYISLDDTISAPQQNPLYTPKNEKEKQYYQEVLYAIQAHDKIKKNLEKLYIVGVQNATDLLLEIDNNVCLGPFDDFFQAEEYYFKLATLFPHASIWLKDENKARRLVQ